VFEYKGKKLKFKLLNQFELSFARTGAQRATLRQMVDMFDKEDPEVARDLMKFHAPSQDVWEDWVDCYVLAATLVNEQGQPIYPEAENDHVVAEEIARSFTPLERADLQARFLDFNDEHDPQQYTDDEMLAILEDIKKNSHAKDPDLLRSYGSGVLRRLVLSIVADLVESEIRAATLEAEIAELKSPKPKSSRGTKRNSSRKKKDPN
jgi:hypothetical protein